MKIIKPSLLFFLGLLIIFSSCRSENDLSIDPPTEEALTTNSAVALLMMKTASNDGSSDNIIDSANCLSVQLPVTVTVNGTTLIITNEDDYQEIEDIIDMFNDDVDTITLSYPIVVVLEDYTAVTVNSDIELTALASTCAGENEFDDDIECIDFQYPITASVFNINNDVINTITINNDSDMYEFLDDLDQFTAVTINFPIVLLLADGTTQNTSTIQELENAIEAAEDTCDEDDDYDYDDDDCDFCTTNDLDTLFATCTDWEVDELERNDNDLTDNYNAYLFTFNNDGTITVVQGTNTWNGIWNASGTGNNITLTISVNGLPDFNNTWNLIEIEQEPGEADFDLQLGEDSLSFQSDC
ncbi:hypothetical protein [Nonlabens sp.]|uniref:hypothetical protein n=1 Tax=Nonlabens sp. TaxID=1888209 RepID=UPI0025F237C9|nr:hypothetical protein [Nonlabens sp.]